MIALVTGGSGSGKSAYAEGLITESGIADRYYIATMENKDEESQRRVDRHRAMRAEKQFQTVECPRDVQEVQLPKKGAVLLECVSNLTANEMFADGEMKDAAETAAKIVRGIRSLDEQAELLVIVTNEVFSDGLLYDPWTDAYNLCLGSVNQQLAALADRVVEVVYTIPVVRKG